MAAFSVPFSGTRWRAVQGRAAQYWAALAGAEQGRLLLWLPALMGGGVAVYFALNREPPAWLGLAILAPVTISVGFLRAFPFVRALALLIAAAALGFSSAQFATLRAPPLEPLPTRAVIVQGRVSLVELLPENPEFTQAFCCTGTACLPPTRSREKLREFLRKKG